MLCENDNEKYSRNPLQLQKSCYTKGHGKGVEAMMTMPEGKAACTVRGITYRYVVKYNGGYNTSREVQDLRAAPQEI